MKPSPRMKAAGARGGRATGRRSSASSGRGSGAAEHRDSVSRARSRTVSVRSNSGSRRSRSHSSSKRRSSGGRRRRRSLSRSSSNRCSRSSHSRSSRRDNRRASGPVANLLSAFDSSASPALAVNTLATPVALAAAVVVDDKQLDCAQALIKQFAVPGGLKWISCSMVGLDTANRDGIPVSGECPHCKSPHSSTTGGVRSRGVNLHRYMRVGM